MLKDKKVLIFGMGKIFMKNQNKININKIIAFSDNFIETRMFLGCPVISPEHIYKLSFDYIVIFTEKFFEKIYEQLIYEIGIKKEKIIGWKLYLGIKDDFFIANEVVKILKRNDYKYILDINATLGENGFFCKESIVSICQKISIDTICKNKYFPIIENVYDNIFINKKDIKNIYDIIFFTKEYNYFKIKKYLNSLIFDFKYCLIYFPKVYTEDIKNVFLDYKIIKVIFFTSGYFLLLKKVKKEKKDIKLYVVTHKKFDSSFLKERFIIQAGKRDENIYLSDCLYNNISNLNPFINECTAMYWIWKNTNSEYVGIEHYRRFFLNDENRSKENIIDVDVALDILDRYDIILVKSMSFYPLKVGESVKLDTKEELYNIAYKIIEMQIKEKQPQYLEAFYYVMNGHVFYKCNMMITAKKIFDSYCEWLFSFIIDSCNMINVKNEHYHNKRIIGFLAERLLTVWIINQKIKIKEMPIMEIK